MNIARWRENVLALNLVRECSAPTLDDGCWLHHEVEVWNSVLHPLQLHLDAQDEGWLRLSTVDFKINFTADFKELDTPYDSTFFTVWLPKKHHCVKEVQLGQSFSHFNAATVPDCIAGTPSKLRYISINGNPSSFDCALLLSALGPIELLVGLKLHNVTVSDNMASEVAKLLLTNARSVRVLALRKITISCSGADILMSGIAKCQQLRELSFRASLSSAGLQHFTTLLRSTETLQELSVAEQQGGIMGHAVEVNYEKNNEETLAAVSDLLKRNATLTALQYRGSQHLIKDLLSALETNNVLRCLHIDTSNVGQMDHSSVFWAKMKSMLAKNKGLRSLIFNGPQMDYHIARHLSEGLLQNTTLECLDLSINILSFSAVQELCSVLGVNKTLCSMKMGAYQATCGEIEALAKMVAEMQCYNRLQILWNYYDAPGLSVALLEPTLCPTELSLNTNFFSDESFSSICKAVASSVQLKELVVCFDRPSDAHVESLCEALRANKSLELVGLYEGIDCVYPAATAAQSLSSNKFIAQLDVYFHAIDETAARMLASLLAANESIGKLCVVSVAELKPENFNTLYKAVVQNQFITRCFIITGLWPNISRKKEGAVFYLNATRLHRAAHFVLRKKVDKVCAEAFEHFSSKWPLLTCLMSQGMSEGEAKIAMIAAGLFVKSNYLFINRVVRYGLECHPGEGTQIDQLTPDCWLAIAKYLKVSDVIEE